MTTQTCNFRDEGPTSHASTLAFGAENLCHQAIFNKSRRSPLLVVATGPYAGEGFDCPALDTLFLAAPIAQQGRLVRYVGRIRRPYDGMATAEVHDYDDELTGVLASSLAKRTPGSISLGFPDPRNLPYTPSADNTLTGKSPPDFPARAASPQGTPGLTR